MTNDRMVAAATALMALGVSHAGVVDLLRYYPIETIERQLEYLPMRKSRRPEALIIDAIRHDYSAPNAYRHAKTANAHAAREGMDEDSQPAA